MNCIEQCIFSFLGNFIQSITCLLQHHHPISLVISNQLWTLERQMAWITPRKFFPIEYLSRQIGKKWQTRNSKSCWLANFLSSFKMECDIDSSSCTCRSVENLNIINTNTRFYCPSYVARYFIQHKRSCVYSLGSAIYVNRIHYLHKFCFSIDGWELMKTIAVSRNEYVFWMDQWKIMGWFLFNKVK